MKKKFHTWDSAVTNFTQDALISFVPLISHFATFVRAYNWNHYRWIRVNVVSLKLKSCFFFWPETPKFVDLGLKVLKTNVWFEISSFKTGYRQNFVNAFWLKVPKFGCLGSNCSKANVTFEISTFVTRVHAQLWGFYLEMFENKCQIWN